MTQVNFYRTVPAPAKIAADLSEDVIVVFNHMTTGARRLDDEVRTLMLDFQMHNDNTGRNWIGKDYFVMIPSTLDFSETRERLRELATEWVACKCPDQVGHL